MVCETIRARVVMLAAVLLGFAGVATWTWSSADYTAAGQVRARTPRSLRADDSDVAHEHGLSPNASPCTQIASSTSAHLAGDDGYHSDPQSPGLVAASRTLFAALEVPLQPVPRPDLNPVFTGFAQSLRGPPFLS